MNRDQYKHLLDKIEPDVDFAERMQRAVAQRSEEMNALSETGARPWQTFFHTKKRHIALAGAMLSLLLIVSFSTVLLTENDNPTKREQKKTMNFSSDQVDENNHYNLPKNKLATSDMVEQIIYQGRVYLSAGLSLESGVDVESLLGQKIGRVSAQLTEGDTAKWQRNTQGTSQIIGNIGESDLYAVRGYNPSFLLAQYATKHGSPSFHFYQSTDLLADQKGVAMLSALNLEQTLQTLRRLDRTAADLDVKDHVVQTFLQALRDASPATETRTMLRARWNVTDIRKREQDIMYLGMQLSDGMLVHVYLYREGYLEFGGLSNRSLIYKLDELSFAKLWEHFSSE